MTKSSFNMKKILVAAVVLCSLITVALVALQRYEVEKANNQVEITLNYEQIYELSLQSEEDVEWWLKEFKDMGATSAAVVEDSLINCLESIQAYYSLTGAIKNDLVAMEALPKVVSDSIASRDDYDLVIGIANSEDFARVCEGLIRYDGLDVEKHSGDIGYLLIDRSENDLIFEQTSDLITTDGKTNPVARQVLGVDILGLPVGFDNEVVDRIHNAGLDVMLRPVNSSRFGHDMFENYQAEIDKYAYAKPVPLLLSAGSDVLGFVASELDYVEETKAFIDRNGFTVALIESNVQRQYKDTYGLDNLVNAYDNDAFVRVFTMWPYIQERFIYPGYSHGEEIGNSMHRAVTERNIRLIHFNPFMWNEEEYVTNIDDYRAVFADFEERIGDHGYSLGRFTVLEDLEINEVMRVLLYIQVLLFGLILVNLGIYEMKMRYNAVLSVLAIIGAVALHIVGPNGSIKLFAFLASIVFSILAAVIYYRFFLGSERNGSFIKGIPALILSGITALVGGLYIGAIMARTDYFLEIELFTGVKLSLLAPIAAVILYMAIAYIKDKILSDNQDVIAGIKKETMFLLDYPIQMKHIVIFGIAGVAGYIYIARSGHESGVDPMQIEIIIRNFLENVLIARPRNKEFFIAFPILILGIAYKDAFKNLQIEIKYMIHTIIMGIGVLGFTSVTNTFSHIRSPLFLSVVRTLISIFGSILVGLVFFAVIQIAVIVVKMLINKFLVKKVG